MKATASKPIGSANSLDIAFFKNIKLVSKKDFKDGNKIKENTDDNSVDAAPVVIQYKIKRESVSQEEYTKYRKRKNAENNGVAFSKEEDKSNEVEIQRPKVTVDQSVESENSLDTTFLKNGI